MKIFMAYCRNHLVCSEINLVWFEFSFSVWYVWDLSESSWTEPLHYGPPGYPINYICKMNRKVRSLANKYVVDELETMQQPRN